MRLCPYLPPIVLLCWAVWSEFADGLLMPVWLLVLAAALFVMIGSLSRRYRNNGQ